MFHCDNALGRLSALLLLAVCSVSQASLLRVTDSETSPDATRHTLHVDLPQVDAEQREAFGIEWVRYSTGGQALVCQPGAPELPIVTQLIEIPDRAGVHIRVIRGESEIVYHDRFWPSQEILHQEYDLPLPWQQDLELYETDAFYPAEPVALSDPALMRNRRLVSLQICPVQVNPVTGEARVWHSLELELSFEGENPINQRTLELADRRGPLDNMIEQQVFRPDAEDGAFEEAYHDPGLDPGRYLVILSTLAQSNAGYLLWREWKLDRGFRITEVTQEDISFSSSNIRNRIIAEYESDDPIDFVILIGDTDGTYAIPSGNNYDQYYSAIEGGDILGDVAVGRISVDNSSQLASVMNKIVTYESDPLQAGDSWLNSVGFTVGSSHCHLSMKTLTRSILGEMVEQRGITNVDTCICCGSSHVTSWFNAGISFYNYRGYSGMESLSCSSVQSLNQGPRCPVATIFTCGTGDFIYGDDFTECFLRAQGGAVASMGFATLGTHTAFNNVVCGGFYGGFLDYHIPYVGSCLIQGEFELWQTLPANDSHATSFANWANLMGDPGTTMWLGTPDEFDDTLPSEIDLYSMGLDLQVSSDGQPVAGVAVCARQEQADGDLQVVALSAEDGKVLLPLDGLETGSLTLTMYHQNYAPVHENIDVTAGMQLNLSTWSINEQAYALPGSTNASLSLTLNNGSGSELSISSITATLPEAYGVVSGDPVGAFTLEAGQSTTLNDFSLSIAADLADDQILPLQLHVEEATNNGTLFVLLPVASALPEIMSISFENELLNPGNTDVLNISVKNVGSLSDDLAFTLESQLAALVQVNTTTPVSINNFLPDSVEVVSFELTAASDAVAGMQAGMRLSWASSAINMAGNTELLVGVGDPGSDDPTGPDSYGYWAYEDLDDSYELAPDYEWAEIVPANGGEGERLPIVDSSNEADDGIWMDLPFDFTFYGQTYTEVFVCSNGFISFAENGFGEVDFRNHYFPSAIGPDAMIAPMWDDHLTGNSISEHGVFYYNDEDLNRVIFTWNDLSANANGGPNTFQLILLNPFYYPSATGDGSFLFQYAEFNDNQYAGTDFPYCSVGIKNHESNVGLNLLNYHTYNSTMHPITDGRAILLTTSLSGTLSPPQLSLGMESISVSFEDAEVQTIDLPLENLGQMPLFWTAHLAVPEGRDSGGPDEFGYQWIDNREPDGPEFQWIDHEAEGHAVSFSHHDSSTAWIDPGIFMHLYGQRFDAFRISPNGYLALSDASAHSNNVELPSENAPEYMVAGWWDDLKPEMDTEGYCWWWSDGSDSLVVTWQSVPHYNPFLNGGPFSFQLILRSLGEITIQILNTDSDIYDAGDSGTVGIQGSVLEGMTLLHNEEIAEQEPWCARLTPPSWVRLPLDAGGVLWDGDSGVLPVTFTSLPGYQIPAGDYHMNLVLECNDTAQPIRVVPLTMNVTTGIEDQLLPTRTALGSVWPNPFNPSTSIEFSLARSLATKLCVYNLQGQRVAVLVDEHLPAGQHQLSWDAGQLASGVYLLQLSTSEYSECKRLLLLR